MEIRAEADRCKAERDLAEAQQAAELRQRIALDQAQIDQEIKRAELARDLKNAEAERAKTTQETMEKLF